jgi:hypothetical protein
MMHQAKAKCKHRSKRKSLCRELGEFCNAPPEYETCKRYEPLIGKRKLTATEENRQGLYIRCAKDGRWKDELEKGLQMGERATLTALGNVKFDVLRHMHGRKDIEIVKLETRHMKSREKGLGLKVTVQKLSTHVCS